MIDVVNPKALSDPELYDATRAAEGALSAAQTAVYDAERHLRVLQEESRRRFEIRMGEAISQARQYR